MEEALYDSVDVHVIENQNIILKIPSLAMIFLLKLIAWNERPWERGKDVIDMAFIIDKFFEINQYVIYDEYYELIDADSDRIIWGASYLGICLKGILNKSERLKTKITDILSLQLQETDSKPSVLALKMENDSIEYSKRVEILKKILLIIRKD